MYDALNHGALEPESLRRSLASLSLPRAGQGGSCSRSMSAPRCARTLHRAQTGCFATSTAAGRGQAQLIAGWPYSFVAAIEPGWTSWSALLDAIRLDPAEDATALTAEQLRGQPASTPSRRSRPRPRRTRRRARTNSDAERGADATTGAAGEQPVEWTRATSTRRRRSHRRPSGPPAAANRGARAAFRAARAPSAPRRDDLLATVRRPSVWSVVHAGSSIVQFGG